MELYKKHRPRTLKQIIGNKSTVATLENMLKRKTLPHTILFHGPSGCGKTTLARILKNELNCNDMDFKELNCSDFRGIDTIRDITKTMNLAPVGGGCRIWLLDEVHKMTGDAQNASLKILEDTPEHVYFFLCTTDPQKLIKTIRTRCCEIPVEQLSDSDIKKLIIRTCKREKKKLKKSIVEDLIDASDGSARKCLVLIDKIIDLSEEEQEESITYQDEKRQGIELCRALIQGKSWSTITKILNNIEDDPEQLRWIVMGYASAVILKKVNHQAYHVLTCFEKPFYDSKKNGLVRACYQSIHEEI